MRTEQEKFMWFEENIRPKIDRMVDKLNNGKSLYYEVYIDLEEEFMRWFDYMYKYPNLAAYSIARWIIHRDSWYWSPSYVKALDESMTNTDNPAEAFTTVLNNSLNRK